MSLSEYRDKINVLVGERNSITESIESSKEKIESLFTIVEDAEESQVIVQVEAKEIQSDVEQYVSTYLDDMFKAIGDKRLGDGLLEDVPKVEGMLPTKPLDRLIALYPEREIAWTGIRKEMADLGYAWSAVKRASRGEILPPP